MRCCSFSFPTRVRGRDHTCRGSERSASDGALRTWRRHRGVRSRLYTVTVLRRDHDRDYNNGPSAGETSTGADRTQRCLVCRNRRDVIGLSLHLCRHLECSAGWLSRLRRKAIFRRLWPIAVTVQHSRAFDLALCPNDLGLALDRNLRLDRGTDRRCDDNLLWCVRPSTSAATGLARGSLAWAAGFG
jgi:hypothetical protein